MIDVFDRLAINNKHNDLAGRMWPAGFDLYLSVLHVQVLILKVRVASVGSWNHFF